MSIARQIVEWAQSRPSWQRCILRRIASGETIGEREFASIVGVIAGDTGDRVEAFTVDDLPSASAEGLCVCLLEIRNAENVNALVPGQKLSFGPTGLTVIYGDNASGKSGYARLIKQMVGARHQENILSDIFKAAGDRFQKADVIVRVDNDQRDLKWPEDKCPELAQVAFFDEACGNAFIISESEVSYRPSALFVMDGLIRVCDGVRAELDKRVAQIDAEAQQLPTVHANTNAARFLESLSSETSEEDIRIAARVPDDVEAQISRLATEEARLQATDPSKEGKRLLGTATRLERLSTHIHNCDKILGEKAQQRLFALRENWIRKREAATIASERSFDREPLLGVGSNAWRDLWEAARQFAAEACPGHPFPVTGPGARCVLCHQMLAEDASERLQRFEAFVCDTTQRELDAAAKAWSQAYTEFSGFVPRPADVTEILNALSEEHNALVADYRQTIDAYRKSHTGLLEVTQGQILQDLDPYVLPKFPHDLDALVRGTRSAAGAIDDRTFTKQLQKTIQNRRELEATRSLASKVENVLAEVRRLQARARLMKAKESTETRTISRKSADLTREYVTTVMRDRFTRESDRLKLERVTLQDIGGRKGSLRHQPAFVGAVHPAQLPKVLSEGEQTAISLAGFLTEVHFDSSKSAVVLDDPVSSLDHVRRGLVADRLVELAKDRQVIVFTHDIAFVADIRSSSDREGVQLFQCSVERRGSGEPGVCRSAHPWKAKDVKQRLQQLEQDLAAIRRQQGNWDQETYEKETAEWAGKLSETWERMINLEVVGQVVDRGTQEVRPKMFRVLALITEDDDREFQGSYAVCSRWARRHDKSIEMNYVPPKVDEMAEELNKVRTWYDRVRKYRD